MATISTISVVHQDKTISQIYCHWDGYLSHNGFKLISHYNSQEKVEELIALGDLNYLGKDINPNPDIPHDFENSQDEVCIFYERDRKEHGAGANKFTDMKEFMSKRRTGCYDYIFMDGKWHLLITKQLGKVYFIEMTTELIDIEEEKGYGGILEFVEELILKDSIPRFDKINL